MSPQAGAGFKGAAGDATIGVNHGEVAVDECGPVQPVREQTGEGAPEFCETPFRPSTRRFTRKKDMYPGTIRRCLCSAPPARQLPIAATFLAEKAECLHMIRLRAHRVDLR